MPIYEYECEDCGHQFELLIFSWSDPPVCERCECDRVRRLPSVFGVRSGGKATPAGGGGCGSCNAASCAGCGSAGGCQSG
jgi:putative FmdB family regulatory protein